MVCIYCDFDTHVINSRQQKRPNTVWRRRKCNACDAVFTTKEAADLSMSFLVRHPNDKLEPFMRDKLYTSILQACDPSNEAYQTAAALTETILAKLRPQLKGGTIEGFVIARTAAGVMKRFQPLLALRYASMHPESFDAKKLARGVL